MKYTYIQSNCSAYEVADQINYSVKKGWEVFTILSSSNQNGGMGQCVIVFRRNAEDFARFNEELEKVKAKLPPYDK
jgi:hypothetical protein